MDTIISLQPRTGGAAGGKSSDEVCFFDFQLNAV
jgi:hypothetical protein